MAFTGTSSMLATEPVGAATATGAGAAAAGAERAASEARSLGLVFVLVINLLDVLGMTKNSACPADRPVECLVFGLECACGHAGDGRRRAEPNKAL